MSNCMSIVYKSTIDDQVQIIERMQSIGFNVVTCGHCGDVILYNDKMKRAELVSCPHCEAENDYSDNPDLFYEGMPNQYLKENY